jgi:hypothetical protein
VREIPIEEGMQILKISRKHTIKMICKPVIAALIKRPSTIIENSLNFIDIFEQLYLDMTKNYSKEKISEKILINEISAI